MLNIYHSFVTQLNYTTKKLSLAENKIEHFVSLRFCNINFKIQF